MSKRPNFVFFMTDQQRADWLGCAGHPVLNTPHIDAIASTGIRFENFYVASPVCMPNRASFLTGRYPTLHGLRYNGCNLSTRANTFVDVLRAAGYRTASIGKSHIQPFTSQAPIHGRPTNNGELAEAWRADSGNYTMEEPAQYESGGRFEIPTPYYGYDHLDMVTSHGDQCLGHYRQWFREQSHKSGNWQSLHDPANELQHNYSCPQVYRTPIPEALYPTSWIRDRAIDWIDSQQQSTEPFFTFVSFPDPHHPFNPPGKYWGMYNPDDFALHTRFEDHRTAPPPLQHLRGMFDRGEVPPIKQTAVMESEQHLKEAMALTAGMITMVDDAVGAIVDHLKATGLYDNTVLCFNSDHGDYLGDSNLLLKGCWARDSINKVPFIWSDPVTRDIRNTTSTALASTIDISTTILDRAGLNPYYGIQGKSLLDVINGESTDVRDSLLIEFNDSGNRMGFDTPARVRTVQTKRYRLSCYRDQDWGELYDLQNDPECIDNVWDKPEYTQTRQMLTEQLLSHMMHQMDESPIAKRLA